jgi:hypothetical protein
LLIEVLYVDVRPKSKDNSVGLVEEPSQYVVNVLRLRSIAKQVELKITDDTNGVVRYEWNLVTRSGAKGVEHLECVSG